MDDINSDLKTNRAQDFGLDLYASG